MQKQFLSALVICLCLATSELVFSSSADAFSAFDGKLNLCGKSSSINVATNKTMKVGVTAKLREVQRECGVAKRKASGWKEPCDPRVNLPLTFDYGTKFYLLNTSINFTAQEQAVQCVAATEKRCYWTNSDFFKSEAEENVTKGIGPNDPPLITKKEASYFRFWDMTCAAGHQAMIDDARILSDKAIETLSEQEYQGLTNGKDAGGVRQRALEASLQLDLPKPSPRMMWLNDAGRDYTLVNGPTWYATDASTFTNRIKYARAGRTWVQVTAKPIGLAFTANGEPWTWCAGPGVNSNPTGVANAIGNGYRPLTNESPDGCSKRFQTSSPGIPDQPVTGSMQIRWQISYTGSAGITGNLPDMHTNTTVGPFTITEAQALVTK